MPTLGARDIKILKVVPSFVDNRITTEANDAEYLRDSFASLATVEYRLFGSSRIRMGGLDVAASDYLRKVDPFKFVGRLVTSFFNTRGALPLIHSVQESGFYRTRRQGIFMETG